MTKFTTLPSQDLTLEMLAENNITPKDDYPYMWKVGNKHVGIGELEDLLEMAKLRVAEFEARMK